MHSCTEFPLDQHFKNKQLARSLFDQYISAIESTIGKVKIESLPCCIHLVSDYTFGAAWARKDGLRIEFKVNDNISSDRFVNKSQSSSDSYRYFVDIKNANEIDAELLEWTKQAYSLEENAHH